MPRLSRKTKQFSFWRLIITAVAVLLALVLINTLLTGVLGLAKQAEQMEQMGKHTVIVFTAPGWCGPCRALEADRQFQKLLTDCRRNPDCNLIVVNGDNPSRLLADGRPYQGVPPSGWPTVVIDGVSFVGDRPEMRQALAKVAQQPPTPPSGDERMVPVPKPEKRPATDTPTPDIEQQIRQIQDIMMKTGKALNIWRLEKSPEERQKLEEQANQMLVLADKAIKLLEAKRGVLKLLEEMEKQMDKVKDDSAKLEQMKKTRERAEKILKDISEKLAKLTPSPPPAPLLSPAPTPPYPSTPQPQPRPLPQPGSIMSLEELNDFTRRGNPIPLGQLMRTSDGRIWQWNGTGWGPAR